MDDHIQCQESISAWNTSDPVFQECLEKTVIPWTPCALLLLGIPLRLFSPFTDTKNGTLRTVQKVITVVVGVLTLGYIGINVLDIVNGDTVPTTLVLSPVVVTISLMITWFDKHQKDQNSNSFLKLTWIIVFLAVIVRLFLGEISSMIFFKNGIKDIINCTTLLLYFILVMCDVIRSIYSEVAEEDEEDCINQTPPESRASLLSLVLFNWISPLIWKAQRRTIERRDLWPLMEENKAVHSIARFEKFWTLELETARKKQDQSEEKGEAKESRKDKEKPWLQGRLLVCLCKTYGPILLLSAFYKLLYHLTELIFPSILRSLILIATGESETNGIGYFYAFLLFAVTLTQAIFVRHHIQKTQEAGMRCLTALTVAIYKKTLKLSNAARKGTTVGENINLISVDAGQLSLCMWCVNDIWAVPLLFCLSFYCLWQTLGISVLVGFVVIVVLVPLYLYLVRKSKALHETKSKLKDSRMKIMNEILNGIQVLKIYAWENSFEKQISDVREKELEVIGTIKRIDSCIHLICTTTPFLMSLLIFATYVLIDSKNMVTADTAFVAISYFSILNWTMIVGAHTITNLLQGSVSLKRIEDFFGCEELDDEYIDRHLDCKYGIAVTEGTFTWDKTQDPTIKNINIHVPDGSLVAVVGSVGSGKSSLLSAMLGEMECVSGKVNIKGKVAYVAQQAWIMNTTLQKNILFGDDLNQKRYNAIIDATTLRKDLDIFDGGDQTEIGEKGINLSGGQKQRVSLARAVYQDADIYLFDDPLSAVDSHVGKHIFEEVIGQNGLLKNKTRVLVTHGISFLPKVDKIITLVEGQIGEVGSFKELIGHNGAFAEYLKSYMIEELTCGNPDEEIEALAITEQLVSQMDNKGNEAILKRQLSDIAHHKRTECESATISHSDTNSTGSREIRRPLSRAHSRELMRQSSNIESEHLEQFIMKHNVARQKSKHFSRQMSLHIIESSSRQVQDSYLCDMAIKTRRRQLSFNSKDDDICTDDTIKEWRARHLSNVSESAQLKRQLSRRSSIPKSEAVKFENMEISKTSKFIQDETVEVGTVKLGVLMAYAKAIGFKITVVIILANILHKISVMSTDVWLSKWTNDNTTSVNGTIDEYKRNTNLGIYAILGILQSIVFFFAQYFIRKATLISTRRLHLGLLRNILRSPMSFFDTVPIGRIVNRFSKDIQTIDDNLLQDIVGAMLGILYIICDVTVISSGSFYFVIAIIPLSVAYFYLQRLVTKPITQLRRMESAARSPIFSYFSETISGCTTIRAFRQQTRFMGEIGQRCEELDMCHHLQISTMKWLHIRNEIVGGLIVFFTAFFTILNKDTLSPGLVGLTLMYSLNVTIAFRRFVWFATSVESQIVSLERIKEYSETPTEADWVIEKTKPKKDWPDKGCIEFTDYAVRYKEGLDLVLKGITCHIKPCEKIGIVGRTGAGKSSLTRALFRIIESARGTIKIDGIDIATIGLHDLRSKITIIPQDPVLFSGTLRMNLDPFEDFSNDQLWQALEHAHLKTFVSGLKDGLDYHCSEGGENLSVGQRQLICLARALLRKSKILVLDEATAAVDLETDDLIQATIRREFDDCTILTIAHRLNTIIDYTRIMVLDFGLIKEFDTPTNLLQNSSSMFYGMAKDAGLV